jgi:hypothetical protein
MKGKLWKEQIDNGELEMTRENKFIKWQVHKMNENANKTTKVSTKVSKYSMDSIHFKLHVMLFNIFIQIKHNVHNYVFVFNQLILTRSV